MPQSIRDNPKKRGRPKTTGKGRMLGVRVQADLLAALDRFRDSHDRELSRPEAVRLLVSEGLREHGYIRPKGD